jgi:hypothetical protein
VSYEPAGTKLVPEFWQWIVDHRGTGSRFQHYATASARADQALGSSVALSGLQIFYRVSVTQGCVAALLALGFIRLPLRGKHDVQPTGKARKTRCCRLLAIE